MNKPEIKKLSARRGKKSLPVSLDAGTFEQFEHIKAFIKHSMNLEVSNSLLVRRAIHLLLYNFYEDLILKNRTKEGQEEVEYEAIYLKFLSQGFYGGDLPDVSSFEYFPTWNELTEKVIQIGKEEIFDSLLPWSKRKYNPYRKYKKKRLKK